MAAHLKLQFLLIILMLLQYYHYCVIEVLSAVAVLLLCVLEHSCEYGSSKWHRKICLNYWYWKKLNFVVSVYGRSQNCFI